MAPVQDDLDLLAVFHYVLAALATLVGLLPLLQVALGVAVLTGAFDDDQGGGPPEVLGWLLIALGAAFILAAFGYAALLLLAGRFLKSRRHWTYCLVMAAVSCSLFPFGTALGVFTILALSRPGARALFEGAGPAG